MIVRLHPSLVTLGLAAGLLAPMALQGQALEGEAYAKADEAYRLFEAGNLARALESTEAALRLAPGNRGMQRLKLDILMAKGPLDAAEAWLQVLRRESPQDVGLEMAQITLDQKQGRSQKAIEAARQILGRTSTPPGDAVTVRLMLADLFLTGNRHQEAAESLEPLQNVNSFAVQSRLGYALLGQGQAVPAMAAFRKALAKASSPEDQKSALTGLLDASRRSGDGTSELQALQALRALNPGDARLAKETGYALANRGRDAEALAAFKASFLPSSTSTDYLDAAYAAKRAGRNSEARDLFAKAIAAEPADKPLEPAFLFGLRREVESLSRTWGGSLGTDYHQGGLLPGFVTSQKVVQQGAEVYYQPESLARNGRMVQVYVQGFENIYDGQGGLTGGPTLQPSVGVRVKPFASQNLVLAAQRLFQGGKLSQQDWLFRAAYSVDQGVDLKAGEAAWMCSQVYTEGAYLLDAKRFIQTLEARWGRTWRLGISEGLVATPHLVLAGDYDNRAEQRTSAGLGGGFALRKWFRESRSMAPASWVELSVQYRFRLTDADRGGGTFARLAFWF